MHVSALAPHTIYRHCYGPDVPKELQGKAVVFLGTDERLAHVGAPTIRVALLTSDGSNGEEWLVRAGNLLTY